MAHRLSLLVLCLAQLACKGSSPTPSAKADPSSSPSDSTVAATTVALALDEPVNVCGMTVTLSRQGHKQFDTPDKKVVGIWEFALSKGGETINVDQTASTLYAEGLAFGCLYVLEGSQGSERITVTPSTGKPLTDDEAVALAESEVKARKQPHGSGKSYGLQNGVLHVTFDGDGGHTTVLVGTYTRRILSIGVDPR